MILAYEYHYHTHKLQKKVFETIGYLYIVGSWKFRYGSCVPEARVARGSEVPVRSEIRVDEGGAVGRLVSPPPTAHSVGCNPAQRIQTLC